MLISIQMLAIFRTYRLVPTLLAFMLTVSSSVPLLQHLCAEGQVRFKLVSSDCCCEEEEMASMHHGHHGKAKHSGMAHAAVPPLAAGNMCDHQGTADHAPMAGDCCNVEVVQGELDEILLTKVVQDGLALPLLAVLADAYPSRKTTAAVRLPIDTGPPPLPVPLHVLNEVFLN